MKRLLRGTADSYEVRNGCPLAFTLEQLDAIAYLDYLLSEFDEMANGMPRFPKLTGDSFREWEFKTRKLDKTLMSLRSVVARSMDDVGHSVDNKKNQADDHKHKHQLVGTGTSASGN